MSDSPFTTIGDKALEARIVAWVLGEASAFEAAELECLCDGRPEFMIFKRRMLALHGMLAEAERSQADELWKLSHEKRKAVEEILGDEKPIRIEVVKEKHIRRSAMRTFLTIAACLMITVIILGLSAPMVIRPRKKQELAKQADMPVLRDRFSSDEKSDFDEQSSLARRELRGANTYTGETTVVGGSLGLGHGYGYGGGGAPASPSAASMVDAKLARDGASAPNAKAMEQDARGGYEGVVEYGRGIAASGAVLESSGVSASQHPTESEPAKPLNLAGANSFSETSELAEASKKTDELEHKLQVGNNHEHLFRGADLAKDKTSLPVETAALAKREAPKPDLSKLIEEIPAIQEPCSTFSLNISDSSFRVAQTALAKGERPDPVGIKVEQFYNAVDYGDPSPAAGEPVACAIEQAAHPVIPGLNLVRVALKTAAAGRSASQPLQLTLLVDQSGSMVRDDRRMAMNKALAGLSELLTANDLVTVIGFSRTPRLLADGMPGDKAGKLADLVNIEASEGGTNLEQAIKLGEQMAGRRKLAGAQNRIVLFTDGAVNLGNADPERLSEKVKQLRQKGIAFDIAGISAEDLNDELLGELARNGNGRYYVVGKGGDDNFAKQLAGAFRPDAENVKVQVRFNPKRVGRYKLIGFEKDRLKTEDFLNDKVDAAELAAEEAGVAIYQVEPLPEGHGELGEVSVRFRDTGRNEMVERSWTIFHDNGAPAIDRATPSMQLATLAMLAGEKLKGGSLADAIDFKQLTAPAANVKQHYGNTGRVAEVLRMVDALK